MADFTTANLPGANEKFNTVRGKFTSLKTSLKSNMEVDASSLSSTLKTDITSFADELKNNQVKNSEDNTMIIIIVGAVIVGAVIVGAVIKSKKN